MKNLINKVKDNKVLSISIIVGVVMVLGLILFKIVYFQKGIGMSVNKKQSQIDKIILKGNYNKAYKLADVYFENESDENKQAINERIKRCEETKMTNIENANKMYDSVKVQKEAKLYSNKKITVYNINDWINDLGFKANTTLINECTLKGIAKIKFTYEDKYCNILEQNTVEIEFDGTSNTNVVDKPSQDTISKVNKVKCSIEELHFNKD